MPRFMKRVHALLGIKKYSLSPYDWLILLAPIVIFFSYQPLISLGRGSYETHYEVSLTELYLVIFALASLPLIWKNRQSLLSQVTTKISIIFALYNTLSIAWSPDKPRAILTAGIIWLLVIFLFALLSYRKIILTHLIQPLTRILIWSAVIVSVFALVQFTLGLFPQTSQSVLLCPGCQANQFGFVRPNAFAVEPQFFGSMLTAPLFVILYLSLHTSRKKWLYFSFGFLFFMLVLTMSRGAIYSFAVGLLVFLVFERNQLKKAVTPSIIAIIATCLAFCAQGLAAEFNPSTKLSFLQAVSASVNQLSFGKITLYTKKTEVAPQKKSSDPVFSGYVGQSTGDRMNNTCRSGGILLETPTRIVFGVGLGGTGYYFETEPTRSAPWCKMNL